MSEPESAFLKLEIARPALVRWLAARPSPASRWSDWRNLGGEWYLDEEPQPLAEASDAAVAAIVREADAVAGGFADNRELLHQLIRQGGEAQEPRLAAFDRQGRTFVAGTLLYAEGLGEFVTFLALARSAADHLDPSGHGLAVIHNYLWGDEAEQTTTAALRMMPSGDSRLLAEPERSVVVPAFQPIADALVEGELPEGFTVRDQLRLLQ